MSLTSSPAARRASGPLATESAARLVADEPDKRLSNVRTEFSGLYRSLENEKLANGMLILQLKRMRQGLNQQLELARRGVAAAANTSEVSPLARKLDDDGTVAGLFAAQVMLRGKLDTARREIKAMHGKLQDAALERKELRRVKAALQAIDADSVVLRLQARVDTLQAGIAAADAVGADQALLARDAEGRRVERHGELLRARKSLHCRTSCKRQLALQLTAAAKAEQSSKGYGRSDLFDGSFAFLGDLSGIGADHSGVDGAGASADGTRATHRAVPPHDETRRRIQTALQSFEDLAAPLTGAGRAEAHATGVCMQPARCSSATEGAFVLRSDNQSLRQPRGARPGSACPDLCERRAAAVSADASRQAQHTESLTEGSGCGADAGETSSGFMTSPRELDSLEDGPCAVATVHLNAADVRLHDTRMLALLGQDWGDARAESGNTESVAAGLTLAAPLASLCADFGPREGSCLDHDSGSSEPRSLEVHAGLYISDTDHDTDERCNDNQVMPRGEGACSSGVRQARLLATPPDLGPRDTLCAASSVVLAPKQRSRASSTSQAFLPASGPRAMLLDRGSSGRERNVAGVDLRSVGAMSLTAANAARSHATEAAAGAGGRAESLLPICRSTSSSPVPSRATLGRSPSFSQSLQAAHSADPPPLERARAAPAAATPLLPYGDGKGGTGHTPPAISLGIRGVPSLHHPTPGQRAVRVSKHTADGFKAVAAGLPPLSAGTAARRGLSTCCGVPSSMTRPRVVPTGGRGPKMASTGRQLIPMSRGGKEAGDGDRLFLGGTVGAFAPMSSRTDSSDAAGTLIPTGAALSHNTPDAGGRDSRGDARDLAAGLEPWAMASRLASLMLSEPTATDAFAGGLQLSK